MLSLPSASRHLNSNLHIIQIDVSVAIAIVRRTLEMDSHIAGAITNNICKVDLFIRPSRLTSETCCDFRLCCASISGNINREVATCRVLPPETQHHGVAGGEVHSRCHQEVGISVAIGIRVETQTRGRLVTCIIVAPLLRRCTCSTFAIVPTRRDTRCEASEVFI